MDFQYTVHVQSPVCENAKRELISERERETLLGDNVHTGGSGRSPVTDVASSYVGEILLFSLSLIMTNSLVADNIISVTFRVLFAKRS
jgi:hypothetical protein